MSLSRTIAAALTAPEDLGLPFGCWTLDRLEAYLNEHKGIPIKRSRIDEILLDDDPQRRAQRQLVSKQRRQSQAHGLPMESARRSV